MKIYQKTYLIQPENIERDAHLMFNLASGPSRVLRFYHRFVWLVDDSALKKCHYGNNVLVGELKNVASNK